MHQKYVIYRHGANLKNQPRESVRVVDSVEASSRHSAKTLSESRVGVVGTQYLEARPWDRCSKRDQGLAAQIEAMHAAGQFQTAVAADGTAARGSAAESSAAESSTAESSTAESSTAESSAAESSAAESSAAGTAVSREKRPPLASRIAALNQPPKIDADKAAGVPVAGNGSLAPQRVPAAVSDAHAFS